MCFCASLNVKHIRAAPLHIKTLPVIVRNITVQEVGYFENLILSSLRGQALYACR